MVLICKLQIRGGRDAEQKEVLINIRFNAGKFELNDHLKAADRIITNILWDGFACGQ